MDLPVAPKKVQVALIALLAGIMLPALWIYIRSLLNTSVHTKKELKAGVNIPFLGEVPLEKNKHEKISWYRKAAGKAFVRPSR